MESFSKKTGKKFTGKFASTAVRIGLATLPGDQQEIKQAPKKKAGRKPKK